MNRAFIRTGILFYVLLLVPISARPQNFARPTLVREVLAGKRDTARVSWWGFDAKDATDYLQAAINSRAKAIIIDRQESAWITRPLKGVSNQRIVFEQGAELVALRGAFHSKGDCLLSFLRCTNVTVRGEKQDGGKSACLRMHKADYQSSAYDRSEWRHGLTFSGCRNVRVQDLTIERTGGDGIYLGAASSQEPNVDVVIRRVVCAGNHRQGISVISAQNLLIEDCVLRDTRGTAPEAGIDFEPNAPEECLVNCRVRRCLAENNAGTGYQICPQAMNGRSIPISIYLENCISRSNTQHAVHVCTAPKDAPGGRLRITHFLSEGDAMAGLSVQFNPCDALRIEMSRSVICNSARQDEFFVPLYVEAVPSESRPAGNIHFEHVTVKDDRDRQCLRISDRKGHGFKDITGKIVLERNGQRKTITIDDAWLRAASTAAGRVE